MSSKRGYDGTSGLESEQEKKKRKLVEWENTVRLKALHAEYLKIIGRPEPDSVFENRLIQEPCSTPPVTVTMKRGITLVQYNTCGSWDRFQEVKGLNADIMAIQDPPRIDPEDGYEAFYARGSNKPRCVTYVRSRNEEGVENVMLEASPTHVTLRTRNVVITNVYNKSKEQMDFEKIKVEDGQYVLGDFNIHSERWGKRVDTSDPCKTLEEWIDINGLKVLTPKNIKTFLHSNSTIDLLLGPADSATLKDTGGEYSLRTGQELRKDHKWLLWELNPPERQYSMTVDSRLFALALDEMPISDSDDLEEYCFGLTQMVQIAMDKARIKVSDTPLPKLPESLDESVPPEEVSKAEVEQLVFDLQGDPGPDNIAAPVVRIAWQNKRWQNAYFNLVNRCVRDGYHPWQRIVTASGENSSLLGRVVESLVRKRLMRCLDRSLCDWQFAGRTGYNATDAAFCVLQKLKNNGKVMTLSANFDEVTPEKLLCSMEAMDVPETIVRWTASLMGDRTKGIPKDSPVSNALFSIYVDSLLREINGLAYADQIVLINQERGLCEDYEKCLAWGRANKVVFENTAFIKKVSQEIAVGDLCGVPFRPMVEIFGIHFHCSLKFSRHIRKQGQKFLCAVYQCFRAAKSIGEAIKLYKTRCRPIIEAANKVWYPALSKLYKKELVKMEDMALRKLMHITGKTSTTFNLTETGVVGITNVLEQAHNNSKAYRLKEVLRMAPQNPVRHLLEEEEGLGGLKSEESTPDICLKDDYVNKTQPLGPLLAVPTRAVKNLLYLRALYASMEKSAGNFCFGSCPCGKPFTAKHFLVECELSAPQRETARLCQAWPQVLYQNPGRIIEFLDSENAVASNLL